MSNQNPDFSTADELLGILRERFLKEFRLDLHASNIFDRAVHNSPPLPIEEAIKATMDLAQVQFYWKVLGDEDRKNQWVEEQRARVQLWFDNEAARKAAAETNRLLMADKLSRIDYKLLSWKTLNELLRMAEKELLPQDKPK